MRKCVFDFRVIEDSYLMWFNLPVDLLWEPHIQVSNGRG